MHITEITTSVEKIPLKTPFITALRRVENVEFIRVKILFNSGEFAYGEAPATQAITGETLETIEDSIKEIAPQLIGIQTDEALDRVHQTSMGSSAKAALDIALCETLCNLKVVDDSPLQSDVTISLGSVEKMLDDAETAFKEGMDILKVKLGKDISHAIEVTKVLSSQLPEAKLLIDANQAWSYEESLRYITETSEIKLELIEQPVVAKDRVSLKNLRKVSHTPIMADEAAFTLEDVKELIKLEAVDMINIKLMKCGGVSKAIEILEYAREHKIACMLGSMLEGPYSINAALKLAFVYRDVIEYIDLDSPLLYKEQSPEVMCDIEGATFRLKEDLRTFGDKSKPDKS